MAQKRGRIVIDLKSSYHEKYTVREVGGGVSTSIPKQIVERKMRELGLNPDSEEDFKEFREKYCVLMIFDDFGRVDGAFRFVRKDESGGGK